MASRQWGLNTSAKKQNRSARQWKVDTPDHLNNTTHALHQLLSAAKIYEGLIFIGVRSSGAITDSLRESRVTRIYKNLARKAGVDESVVQSISGHSMRVGGAQDLLSVGTSLPQIMVKAGQRPIP